MISQTRLLKFKTYPSNWLYKAYFKFEENFMNPIELPAFPKELQVNSLEIKKSIKKISAFAISRYLIQDLTNIRPRHIFKNLVSIPMTLFKIISQARSKY